MHDQKTKDRVVAIDMIRGIAIVGVVLFHMVWDLAFLGMIPAHWASNTLWIAFGRTLAGTFMILVGISFALAARNKIRARPFLRRLGVITAAALAITVVTRLTFPEAYVYFGILHAIVVATLVCAVLIRARPLVVIVLGITIVFIGNAVEISAFDPRHLAWIGFAADPPFSNDFVPVFPWVGLSLIGLGAGRIIEARGWFAFLAVPYVPIRTTLVFAGRWSLTIYLLHQPILLAILVPLSWIVGRA